MKDIKRSGVVILLGGSGRRFGGKLPKQFVEVDGKPLFFCAVRAFVESERFCKIFFVVDKEYQHFVSEVMWEFPKSQFQTIAPGETRQQSVFNALQHLDMNIETVFIHDGARPLVSKELISRCFNQFTDTEAICPAIATADSLFIVSKDGNLDRYLDRSLVRLAQTPQVFKTSAIIEAHTKAFEQGREFTDDTSLFSHYGGLVRIVDGDPTNIKVSIEKDLETVKLFLSEKA